ncbi:MULTISPECIES: hypothetical protein [unclassified Moorena]|uniref:hypothetical protein n=1 Tax=unclassified Moorena TaxID=2683338 RepID=UPI0013F79D6C|nr:MULTISPECIES: hypothetical protein [unclassified Moorena]NEP23237.1 hypothetical protein [Moorena sp. SIO3I6]NEQ56453.1 hypothetical protein [Moorena sp. SIO4A1]
MVSLFYTKAPQVACVAQALALAFRPRYANGHAVRTTLGGSPLADIAVARAGADMTKVSNLSKRKSLTSDF